MKKHLLIIAAVIILSALTLTGCKLSDEEKAVVGTYELTEISVKGYPNITKNTYDYFTIEFKSNKKCTIKSKAGVTTYEASASWKINSDGEIEVITRKGFATATEKYKLDGDILSGTNTGVSDGVSLTMTVKMKRITE